jgi:hypothetical protein
VIAPHHPDGLRRPAPPDVVVDVIVETEYAVWTLIVVSRAQAGNVHERTSEVIDAGGWLAGVREHYCGVIEEDADTQSIGDSLKKRYARPASVGFQRACRSESQGCWRRAMAGFGGNSPRLRRASGQFTVSNALARTREWWLQSVEIETAVEPL